MTREQFNCQKTDNNEEEKMHEINLSRFQDQQAMDEYYIRIKRCAVTDNSQRQLVAPTDRQLQVVQVCAW